jgi:2-polyprenyl-3-methyl-5-hydroxy-6-metoxy-1,4-benzoquinol methylase
MNVENDGERMDIDYYNMNYDNFDIYQKSHIMRYKYSMDQLSKSDIVGDMACGSGYGSMLMSEKCDHVYGYDIDTTTIYEISKRYADESKVTFTNSNLLDIDILEKFDKIVSFETIEHFAPEEIPKLLNVYHNALKKNGLLIFSTPYNQEKSIYSMKHHKSFYITENTIGDMVGDMFEIVSIKYQDYQTHVLKDDDGNKNFIICIAIKK